MGKFNMAGILGLFVVVLGFISALILTFGAVLLVRAYVLVSLWQWFITEQFGVRPIGYLLAIGLSMTIGPGPGM